MESDTTLVTESKLLIYFFEYSIHLWYMKPQLSIFNYSIINQSQDVIDINIDGDSVDSPTLEIYKLYWGDETSTSFKSFRDSIPNGVKTVNVFVNSPGGHVGDAMAIHDYLSDLEANGVTVNRNGRGIVASAATYLVLGNNSSLSDNCLFMMHEVSGYAYGDVSRMENQVKAMRKFNDVIVEFYAKKTGLSSTVIGNMMKAETWLTSQEAKDKGFVQNVGVKANITNKIKDEHWHFTNTAMLNKYNSFISTSNSTDMDATKIINAIQNGFNDLLDKLGIKDKADDDVVKNALSSFTTNVENALKDISVPDEQSIKNMVNTAVTEGLSGIVNSESFKNAITDATKNQVTKSDLETAITTLTNSIADKLGKKSGENNYNNTKRNSPANRFTGKQFWSAEG